MTPSDPASTWPLIVTDLCRQRMFVIEDVCGTERRGGGRDDRRRGRGGGEEEEEEMKRRRR